MLDVPLGNAEEFIFALVKQLGNIKGILVDHVLNHCSRTYQLTLDILLQNDPCMVFNIGSRDNL